MAAGPVATPDDKPGVPQRARQHGHLSLGRAALTLVVAVVASNLLLMSPPRGEVFPGAITWRPLSLLKPLVDLLSLGGLVHTERGTEIKDLTFHAGAVLALLLLAASLFTAATRPGLRANLTRPWLAGQLLLATWVAISTLSSFWSEDPALARGQAALYALSVAWAIGIGWTLQARDLARLLGWLVGASTAAAALCVWYYYERNPYHRPGFPVGNPATLGASLIPAVLTALAIAIEDFRHRAAAFVRIRPAFLPLLALAPLVWAFVLAGSRAATIGLGVGLIALLLTKLGKRTRLLLSAALVLALAAAGWNLLTRSRLDSAMGRSATVRFRLYAWRYAAQLWNQNQLTAILGCGAGQYPRLAAWLSLDDRRLDPAAFMGDLVEHAHNELLETICEIGLLGGLSFVAGMLAILAAAAAAVRSPPPGCPQWVPAALFASCAGMLADALLSPGLRLPVVPAIFYTLVGVIWSTGRSTAASPPLTTGHPLMRLSAAGCLLLAGGATWLTLRNWSGALLEEAARQARRGEDYLAAAQQREQASRFVLNPVRQLTNQAEAIHDQLRVAWTACAQFLAAQEALHEPGACAAFPTTTAAAELWDLSRLAVAQCAETYQKAAQLAQRVPGALSSAAVAASAAELAAQILLVTDPAAAERWRQKAAHAWRTQRQWRPWDFETLMALTEYPAPPDYHVALLRDALRCTEATTRLGQQLSLSEVRARWHQAFSRLVTLPAFEDLLARFLAAVGPITPQTDLDTLVWSGAPEIHRLAAYYHAARGKYQEAQRHASRAAELYQPMRPRFPTLESVALLEQAEFTLAESPRRALQAVELLKTAISRLPQVQVHKRVALEKPFRRAIADSYVALVQSYAREPVASRPDLEHLLNQALYYQPDHVRAWAWRAWLAAERNDLAVLVAVLTQAARAGLSDADLETIQRSLCVEFPALCDQLDKLRRR